MDAKGQGIEKYKVIVTKQSWGCEAKHREHSQQCGNDYV